MNEAFQQSLPMGIGLALSPLPILALVIILMTANARKNALGFLLGWLVGIFTVGIIVYFIPGLTSPASEPSTTSGWVRFSFGVLLLIGAFRQFQQRTKKGEEPNIPRAVTHLDRIGVPQAILTGFLLSGINVKNIMFIAAGTAAIATINTGIIDHAVAFIGFILVGSALLIIPVTVYLAAGTKAQQVLYHWRIWLTRHIHLVLALLLGTIAAILFIQAFQILG